MTQKGQVENHKLTHKVLDTKNLLGFVVSERPFLYYRGILYLFVLAHHPTGWRKLRIQIFGGHLKQENPFSVDPVILPTVLNASTHFKAVNSLVDSQLGLQ